MSELYLPSEQFINPPVDLDHFALGFEYLGGVLLPTAMSNVDVGLRRSMDVLMIVAQIASLSAADSVSFRFNGDSGANYAVTNLVAAQGQSTFSSNQLASATHLQLQPLTSGLTNNDAGGTQNRIVFASFANTSATEKAGSWLVQRGTGVVTTAGPLIFGAGNWVKTSEQVHLVSMAPSGVYGSGAATTMAAGSSVGVFGKDYP